jgi:hypothetical protein
MYKVKLTPHDNNIAGGREGIRGRVILCFEEVEVFLKSLGVVEAEGGVVRVGVGWSLD